MDRALPPSFRQNKKRHFFQKPSLTEQACLMCNGASLFIMRICHQLLCTCAHNCFAQARPMAFRMRALLPCACPIYMNHRHADAIALHMRKPLPCTCAPHWFPHAQAIIPPRPQFANMPHGGWTCCCDDRSNGLTHCAVAQPLST